MVVGVVVEDAFAAGVGWPIAALIFAAFLGAGQPARGQNREFLETTIRLHYSRHNISNHVWRKRRLAYFEAEKLRWRAGRGPAAAPDISASQSSGAEYTPLNLRCQYIVVIFFFNAL